MKKSTMNEKSARYFPLIVTVGQVVVFPYYIIWLKQVTLTFPLFAWFFAAFSFAAAFGYRFYSTKKNKQRVPITMVYIGMGVVYLFIGVSNQSYDGIVYVVLAVQLLLGVFQGYFRAWHTEQETYHLHAIHHYLIVGCTMIGFSFVNVLSPVVFLMVFGLALSLCGVWLIIQKERRDENGT